MKWLKERKYRIWVSLVAGAAGVLVMTVIPGMEGHGFFADCCAADERPLMTSAWWGTMYPKFCFSETSPGSEVKISFWLAKVLGWC